MVLKCMKKKILALIGTVSLLIIAFLVWQIMLMKQINERTNQFIEGSERLMAMSYLALLDTSQPDVRVKFPDSPIESFDYYLRQAIDTAASSSEQVRNAELAIEEYNNRNSVILRDYNQSIEYGEDALTTIRKISGVLILFRGTFNDRTEELETLLDYHREYQQAQKDILTTKYNLMIAISESGSLYSQQTSATSASGSKKLEEAGNNYDRLYDAINQQMLTIERAQVHALFQIL